MAGCRHHGSLRKVRSAIRALSRTGVDVACVITKSPPLLSPRYPPRGSALAPPSRAGVNLIPFVYHCGARYRVSVAVTLATQALYLASQRLAEEVDLEQEQVLGDLFLRRHVGDPGQRQHRVRPAGRE